MQEIDLRGKACVVPVAIVAGLGMAGMGLVSDGVVMADTTSVTDTINVTVQPSCTFNSVQDKTYIGSAVNGTEVHNFNESGRHEFNIFCNDNNGFIVTATPYNLEADGISDVIAYTDNYTHTGINSMWTALIVSDDPVLTVTSPAPVGGGTIISSDSHTTASGVDFTATYKAYVGSETPAGTYSGTIVYTLTASGTSNNSSSNSGQSGANQNDNNGENGGENEGGENDGSNTGGDNGGGTGSGNETPDNTNDNSGSGDTGTGGTGSGDANSGGSSNTPSNTPNNIPSNTQLAMTSNNSYSTSNTYNTANTYNTTYSGGGIGTTGTQVATSGGISDIANGAKSGDEDNKSNSGANDGYEQPLGVKTSTSSSNENSGVDPMLIVAAGATLAVAGVAMVALARNSKEEE